MTEEHGVSPVPEDGDEDADSQAGSGPAARTARLRPVDQNWPDLWPASLTATGDRTQQNGTHS